MQFLNKKSWHTSAIKNVEEVWVREQKEAKEQAKLAALRKELQEERNVENLRKIQEGAGIAT